MWWYQLLQEVISRRLIDAASQYELEQLDRSLKQCLSHWFSGGFLQLEQLTWQSSCDIMEKVYCLLCVMFQGCEQQIKTHGSVSAAKEVMWHTSVLFTGTAKSPFSTHHISITTGLISIKFTYFMPSIYIKTHGSVSAAKEVMWHTSVLSRHTVVCQRPRKSCGTQVSYLQEPLSHHFQHIISL